MEKFVTKTASTVELAIEEALLELNAKEEDVEVEIISKGGLLKKAEVKVSLKETLADKVLEVVNNTLEKMNLSSRATVEDKEDTFYVTIEGSDSGAAIGYRGEVLDALQYLVLTFLNQEKYGYKKVVVDAENYRQKREETLIALAKRLAEKAHRTCRKVALEPMNPFERRIIHSALADSEIAETISEGEDMNRHIVIIPKGVEIRQDRPRRNSNGYRKGNGGDKRPNRREEEEVEDGRTFRGYYSTEIDTSKNTKQGPPKFKSFGGAKRF